MTEGDDPLKSLDARLRAAEEARQPPAATPDAAEHANVAQQGFRVIIDLTVPLVVGVVAGLWLDRTFATAPLFIIIFILLGCGVAIMNVLRLAGGYGEIGFRKKPPNGPAQKDETRHHD